MNEMLFGASETISVRFASHGSDHLCLAFYNRAGQRVSSFCAERVGRTDYYSEKEGECSHNGLTLAEAIALAEAE